MAVACSSPTPESTSQPPGAAAPAPAAPAGGAAPAPHVEREGATPGGTGTAATSAPPPVAPPAPAPPPPPPPPREFTLAADRPIAVYTTTTLSTKTNQAGEKFSATLAEAIVDDDWVIAKKGARVEGVIVDSDPGDKVKGVASITVSLESLTLADGRTVRLATSHFTHQAKTTKKKDATKIGVGCGSRCGDRRDRRRRQGCRHRCRRRRSRGHGRGPRDTRRSGRYTGRNPRSGYAEVPDHCHERFIGFNFFEPFAIAPRPPTRSAAAAERVRDRAAGLPPAWRPLGTRTSRCP